MFRQKFFENSGAINEFYENSKHNEQYEAQ